MSGRDHSTPDPTDAIENIDLVYEAAGASSASFKPMWHLDTNGVFVVLFIQFLKWHAE